MSMYDDASKRVGSGLYLKLDAGEKRIRILDHPFVANKPGFREEDPVRTVFTWIVWNYDENRVQVVEQGPGLFKMIGAIIKVYGETMPMECDLVIATTGSGVETRRSVVAAPKAGTMPPLPTLQAAPNWPDLGTLTGGVPLSRFAKEGMEPAAEPKKPTHLDAEALNRSNDGDVVIRDLDEGQEVNLDDIPF